MKLALDKLTKPGSPGSPGSPGGESFWTPQGIKEVINGIKELLQQYNQMRTGQASPGTNVANVANVAQTGVSKAELINFMQQFLDNLIAQGNGDKTILAVLKDFPATIKQLRGMLG